MHKEAVLCLLILRIFYFRANSPGVSIDLICNAIAQSACFYRAATAHCFGDFRIAGCYATRKLQSQLDALLNVS